MKLLAKVSDLYFLSVCISVYLCLFFVIYHLWLKKINFELLQEVYFFSLELNKLLDRNFLILLTLKKKL